MEDNPYAAPRETSPAPLLSDEVIRHEHLKHEAAVRGAGSLYFLGGILLLFLAVAMGFTSGGGQQWFLAIAAILLFWIALQLRKLKPAGRIAAMALSGFAVVLALGQLLTGMTGSPPLSVAVLVIHGYILLALSPPKNSFVCSPRYWEIVAATPHIKCRTPLVVVILVSLLLFGLVMLLLGF